MDPKYTSRPELGPLGEGVPRGGLRRSVYRGYSYRARVAMLLFVVVLPKDATGCDPRSRFRNLNKRADLLATESGQGILDFDVDDPGCDVCKTVDPGVIREQHQHQRHLHARRSVVFCLGGPSTGFPLRISSTPRHGSIASGVGWVRLADTTRQCDEKQRLNSKLGTVPGPEHVSGQSPKRSQGSYKMSGRRQGNNVWQFPPWKLDMSVLVAGRYFWSDARRPCRERKGKKNVSSLSPTAEGRCHAVDAMPWRTWAAPQTTICMSSQLQLPTPLCGPGKRGVEKTWATSPFPGESFSRRILDPASSCAIRPRAERPVPDDARCLAWDGIGKRCSPGLRMSWDGVASSS